MSRRAAVKVFGQAILAATVPIAFRSARGQACLPPLDANGNPTVACPAATVCCITKGWPYGFCCANGRCCGAVFGGSFQYRCCPDNTPICYIDEKERLVDCRTCVSAGGVVCGNSCCNVIGNLGKPVCASSTLGLCCSIGEAACGRECCKPALCATVRIGIRSRSTCCDETTQKRCPGASQPKGELAQHCCLKEEQCCAGDCCRIDEICINGACRCKTDVPCGERCCQPGEACCGGVGNRNCHPASDCCGDVYCPAADWDCVKPRRGRPFCVPKDV